MPSTKPLKKGEMKPASFPSLTRTLHTKFLSGIKLLDAKTGDGLFDADAERIYHTHGREIEFCHAAAIQRKAEVKGTVMIEIRVGPSGKVMTVSCTSKHIQDQPFLKCLEEKISEWIFPMPRKGKEATVTFRLGLL